MNRYLLITLFALLGISTAYGVSTRSGLREFMDDARSPVSSTPTSASEGRTGLESAGQNIIRQTSEEALDSPRENVQAEGQTVPAAPTDAQVTANEPPTAEFPEQNLDAVQPVAPADTQPNNPDAIPALW